MGHTGGDLAEYRKLVGLDQFVAKRLATALGAFAFVNLEIQLIVGGPELDGALVDAPFEIRACGHLGATLDFGELSAPQEYGHDGHQQGRHQRCDGAGVGDGYQDRRARGRQKMKGPARGRCVRAGGHPALHSPSGARGDHARPGSRRPERQGRQGVVAEGLARQNLSSLRLGHRGDRAEPPVWHTRDQDDAGRICDIGWLSGAAPVGFQPIKLDLDDCDPDDAAVFSRHALRQIEARSSTDGPKGEELGAAGGHGADEVGTKAVVLADETGRQTPVAGGLRHPVGVQQIDGGCAGLTGQPFQLAIDPFSAPSCWRREKGDGLGVLGEHQRQGAMLLQFGAENGGVEDGPRLGLPRQIAQRLTSGHLARHDCGAARDRKPGCDQDSPSPTARQSKKRR